MTAGPQKPPRGSALGECLGQAKSVVFGLQEDGVLQLAEEQIQAGGPAFGHLESIGEKRPVLQTGFRQGVSQSRPSLFLLLLELGEQAVPLPQRISLAAQILETLARLLTGPVDTLERLLVLADLFLCLLYRGAELIDLGLRLGATLGGRFQISSLALQLFRHVAPP